MLARHFFNLIVNSICSPPSLRLFLPSLWTHMLLFFITFISIHQLMAVVFHAIWFHVSWWDPYMKVHQVFLLLNLDTNHINIKCFMLDLNGLDFYRHFSPSVNVRLTALTASVFVEKPAVALICPFTANESWTWPAAEETWNKWKQYITQEHL